MERAEWLKQMRDKVETLYDHLSPGYWVKFGLYANETHREYLQKFLERVPPRSTLLSAACGAGRHDGMLLEAGHSVVGIDQSAGMLARAREHFPEVPYEKIGLQEMDFREAFDGVICIDAMEHVCPEDWPGILRRFREALKPDGALYFTVVLAEAKDLERSYERAKGRGLPAVFGELADEVEEAYERALGLPVELADEADEAAYHYCPSLEQVRAWVGQAELVIEEEGTGNWYAHFVVRKSMKAQIDQWNKAYLENKEQPKPDKFYDEVRCLLLKACAKDGTSDALEDNYMEGINGYTYAAELLYESGHPAAAGSLLIESWNERGKRQLQERKRVYRAGIAWKLADLFLKRRDYGAALWWALHTQADDILENQNRGVAGRWQLRTVLGMSESTLEELNRIADENRDAVEKSHNNDWSHVRGFAEDVVLRFVLDTKISGLFAQESSVREFPLSTAYFSALLQCVKTATTKEKKGKELEHLASYLFLLIPGWVPQRNVLHSRWAFETDLVISNLRPEANLTAELLGRHFPVECKNWAEDHVDVQHVGYFLYRMRLTHSKFGVIFVASQITGHKRGLAADELIRMAFHEDGSICVVLTQADLQGLLEGKITFWSMLLEKIERVRFGKPSRSQSELQSISGIGPKRAKQLVQMGITTPASLVEADAAKVANALQGVTVQQVEKWQGEAGSDSG